MPESIAVGWDVGGWRGSRQGVAVLAYDGLHRAWVGAPVAFTIEALTRAGGGLLDLIRIAWAQAPDDLLDRSRVVLAIDAPLGYPLAYQRLVSEREVGTFDLGPEIENRFAYRDTERHIFATFGRKPLSAPFDRLGNGATVAQAYALRWAAAHGIPIVPFSTDTGGHAILEVYPALVKEPRIGLCVPSMAPLLPPDAIPSTDTYDAAICAIHALAFARNGADTDLPALCGPADTMTQHVCEAEGWIYHLPPAWLRRPA